MHIHFCVCDIYQTALWAKKWLKKTETFSHLETSPYIHRNPIKYVCSHNRGVLIKFILASSIQHGSAYMIFVFLPSYLSSEVMRGTMDDGFIDEYAYTINCINSILFLPVVVTIGYFTDYLGTMPFISVSTLATMCISPFLFYGLAMSTSSIMNWFLQFLLVMACVPVWGCIFYWYIKYLLPDPRTRVTIYGVGYNLGAAFFGGTASLIGTSFVEELGPVNGMVMSGAWMSIMAVLCIGTIGYIKYCEMSGKEKTDYPDSVTERKKAFGQGTMNSTWYLRKLDPIQEEGSSDDDIASFTSDDDRFNSSEENDIATYDQHHSPKRYG